MADRKVRVILEAAVSGFQSQMATASKSVGDAADKMTGASRESEKFRRGLDELGSTAGKVGLAAAAGFGAIVATTSNFEQAMSNVRAATHESEDAMQALRQAALDAGASTVFSASEAAAGIENLAKAGISTKDILAGGLSGALDLAAAGEMSVADASEIAATALTQFKLEGEDVGHVADLLAAGAGKAQGDVSDLSFALKQSGLVASQMGVSIEETTGTLAAFASAGLLGSDAGTSFRTMLLRMANPSKESAKLMRALGIEAYDASGQFVGMADLAGQLQTAFEGKTQAERDSAMATIFGSDAIRAASVLFSQGEKGIRDWTKRVDDSGYAAETAAMRLDNLKGDLEALGGALETALIGAGSGQQGMLREFVQEITKVVDAFNELPSSAQSAVTKVLGITAVLGGGAWFASKAVRGISDTRDALRNLGVTADDSRGKLMSLSNLARVSAGLGSVALAATDLDEDLGVANTAAYALYGTMVLPGWGTAIGAGIGLISDFGASSEAASKKIAALGASLDAAVDSGDMGKIREAASAIQELADALPEDLPGPLADNGAIKALRDQERAADQALRGVHDYAFGLDVLNDVVGQYPEEARKLQAEAEATAAAQEEVARAAEEEAEAHRKAREAAREQGEGWLNLSEAAGDTKKSLGEFLTELEKQGQALANFTENAQKAGRRGLRQGLIDHLEELGPAGARRMQQLANASDEEIGRANRAWRKWINSLDEYTDMNVPPKKPEVDPKQAKGAIRQIRRGLIELGLMKAEPKITVDNSQALAALAAVANSLGALGAPLGLAATLLAATGANQPKGGGKPKPKGDGRIAPSSTSPRGDRVFTEQLGARSPSYAAPAAPAGRAGGGGEIDYDRLTTALSAARPLIGQQIVQPHNYNEFRRQEDKNRRLANLGG